MEVKYNNEAPKPPRTSAHYHPTVWGDYFLAYDSHIKEIDGDEEIELLKDEVKKMFVVTHDDDDAKLLEVIDTIQRLGVSYHFENDIEELCKHMYMKTHLSIFGELKLEIVALRFRLLRQAGYNVSCDVFEEFKDKEGKFKEELVKDVGGLLSLYEAAHLGVREESILEEALAFTTTHLRSYLLIENNAQVSHALKMPIRRTLTRVTAWHYITFYQQNPNVDKLLLQFACIDFNMLQKVHQKELSEITRWDRNASNELPQYLKLLYNHILDAYAEMEESLTNENKSYRLHYAKSELKKVVKAYNQEFKWFDAGYVPSFEEYLKVALVTSCYMMLPTISLIGMDEVVTKESIDWITSEPLMIIASCIICRLMDDRVGHQYEQERGHVASAVESYMKDGGSKQEAYLKFEKMVNNAWKDVNKECLNPTPVPMPVLMRVLNHDRAINLLYKHEDLYTNSKTKFKDIITKILLQPV